LGEQYKSFISSLRNLLQSPVTSSLLGPNILLNTMFSNTLGFLSSRNVSDQASHPYKTTGKITVLYFCRKFRRRKCAADDGRSESYTLYRSWCYCTNRLVTLNRHEERCSIHSLLKYQCYWFFCWCGQPYGVLAGYTRFHNWIQNLIPQHTSSLGNHAFHCFKEFSFWAPVDKF